MRRVIVELLRLARWLLPTRAVVVVHGFPSIEANAVEWVRILLDKTPARVTWLDGPDAFFLERQGLGQSKRLAVRSRASLLGLWDYLTAETVFVTHGVYGSPGSTPRKPVVNLWHGTGPKGSAHQRLLPHRRASGRGYDVVLLGAELWHDEFTAMDNDYDKQVWSCGFPRNGVFARRESRVGDSLARSVIWAPAFRTARVKNRVERCCSVGARG